MSASSARAASLEVWQKQCERRFLFVKRSQTNKKVAGSHSKTAGYWYPLLLA
jgi:hypothetical protein